VITEVGHRILAGTRRDDVVARVGGEEFVALLPDARLDVAVLVAERVRVAICSSVIATPSGPLSASVSVGVAQWGAGESL
jgi:diguanylate cyclase (GGDEF)-like protein